MSIHRSACLPGFAALLLASGALAQAPAAVLSPEQQIAAALLPAPDSLRAGATVLGYDAQGKLITLRKGENQLVCLADDPVRKDFHVACYHKDLDPFMARGRELRLQKMTRPQIDSAREADINAGRIHMPVRATSLYEIFAKEGSFDPATNTVTDGSKVYVVYVPYATTETTGLSTAPIPGGPWLMYPGKPWAHIMIVPEEPKPLSPPK
jgi:hypothetical protein